MGCFAPIASIFRNVTVIKGRCKLCTFVQRKPLLCFCGTGIHYVTVFFSILNGARKKKTHFFCSSHTETLAIFSKTIKIIRERHRDMEYVGSFTEDIFSFSHTDFPSPCLFLPFPALPLSNKHFRTLGARVCCKHKWNWNSKSSFLFFLWLLHLHKLKPILYWLLSSAWK